MARVDQSVRIRALLEDRFVELVILLLILAAVSGWWAYQVHMVPEFEQEEVIIEQWDEGTEIEHSAEIQRDTLVWDAGDIVENRPIYYFNLTEELDGEYRYRYTADSGSVDVTTDVTLIIRAINDEEVFWEIADPLAEGEDTDLAPGENHNVTFTTDMRYIIETIDQVERDLGAAEGLLDPRVEIRTTVEGEVEGDTIDAEHQSVKSLVVTPDTFRVNELDTYQDSHEEVEFRDVPVDPGLFEQIGSLLVFNVLILLLIALLAGQYTGRFAISEDERELLQLESEREEFDEWITTGRFPADRDYEAIIQVDELVGLVDVAIDTNNRVIEDNELGVSAVLDNDYVYVYVHPDSPARDWLVNYADTTMDEFDLR